MRYDTLTLKGQTPDDDDFELEAKLLLDDACMFKLTSTDGREPVITPELARESALSIKREVTGITIEGNGVCVIEFNEEVNLTKLAMFLEFCLAEAAWKEFEEK